MTRRGLAAAILGAPVLWRRSASADLPVPEGRTMLTVTGKITEFNANNEARFDRDMIEALGMTGFETVTPWYSGKVRFEGVPMARVMAAVGATGSNVLAIALNDYSTELPIGDFAEHGVLLALKRDGQYMPVRDKGPLFIVYPFDSNPQLQHQRFYSRAVWQLSRLVVR